MEFEYGKTAPWFGQKGKGVQIKFLENIEELVKEGKIEIINIKKLK
ncbi:glycohydrolase toxin TNT-related protein [Capnocytophaga sp. oral taxon 338]